MAREEDIIELLLKVAKQQMNITDKREDELIHIVKLLKETTTTTETSLLVTKEDHPVKYDEPHAIYDRVTYA